MYKMPFAFLAALCLSALPLSAAQTGSQLPIHLVYVNHVEVESVIEYTPPLVDGVVYTATPAQYAYTAGQIDWEIARAESVGARISFHMSGAFAERAVAGGHASLWTQRLADGHIVGVHFHHFLRGPNPFEWKVETTPTQAEIYQAWQDNHHLPAGLVGAAELWSGEAHYFCPSCWQTLGYRLSSTEQSALLPAGEHIVWLVERSPLGNVVYPHYPQIGKAGLHPGTGITFDLRLGQIKKEFLVLYMEWLERERLDLAPQVWAWGWMNHGGKNTTTYAAEIQEMLTWMDAEFAGKTSARGNLIATFVGDHELDGIYAAYEAGGGQPLPSPQTNINDQFPWATDALADAGVTSDLSGSLGMPGIRLFELERDDPTSPPVVQPARVYLLFRENDGSDAIDLGAILSARGMDPTSATLRDVVGGGSSQVDPTALTLGAIPQVLEVEYSSGSESPFGFRPASVAAVGYPDNGFTDAQTIGVRWHRPPLYAMWALVQPTLGSSTYSWGLLDQQYGSVPDDIRILANITPQASVTQGRCLPGSWKPVDDVQYAAFVGAVIERYDGDGFNDMPGLTNPITHWQVGNEPDDVAISDFAYLQALTYQAIKQACSSCTVLIGGVRGFPGGYVASFDSTFAPILAQLGGQYVDVFDFHWSGDATGDYRLADSITGEDVLDHIRTTLAATGFAPSLPIWITEMGTYSGQPLGPYAYQSEAQQAGDLIKRFLYPLSRGVDKVFPAVGLMEGFKFGGGYFDHTGLIYDGQGVSDLGLGVKKLGYFTYAKMTESLEGSVWSTLSMLRDGTGVDQLYLENVTLGGGEVYVAWWDTFDEPGYLPGDTKPLVLTGLTAGNLLVIDVVPDFADGSQVLDYATAFTSRIVQVVGGSAAVQLGEDPVLIVPIDQAFVLRLGCGTNPVDSLAVVSGAPAAGTTLSLGLDNPLGTQAAGALTFLALTIGADPAYPCGSPVPGVGMSGPGATGELLISTSGPNPFAVLSGEIWGGSGFPAIYSMPIPTDPVLAGVSVFAQGLIWDPAAIGGVELGLTDGLQLLIGT